VNEYLDANPPDAPQKTGDHQTFLNLCLGEPFEQVAESPKANQLQKNIRNYDIATVPENLSKRDGNGQIMLLTCAADLNGTLEDARLDYEIVAWSETGSSYSVTHGSIGTFVPREGSKKNKTDRVHWTYEHNRPNSVWPELTKILQHQFPITGTHGKIRVGVTGIDTGHCELQVFEYINKTKLIIRGLKGDKDDGKFIRPGIDVPFFKQSKANAKLILIPVGRVKDAISEYMKLKWDPIPDESQPAGFMNYPTPADGKYLFGNFFSHYEAEHKRLEYRDGLPIGSRWEKKTSNSQNHMWDVRIYNLVMRDWIANQICKEDKVPRGGWAEFIELTTGKK
jgi:phage terminase large subunit GpA-like protein